MLPENILCENYWILSYPKLAEKSRRIWRILVFCCLPLCDFAWEQKVKWKLWTTIAINLRISIPLASDNRRIGAPSWNESKLDQKSGNYWRQIGQVDNNDILINIDHSLEIVRIYANIIKKEICLIFTIYQLVEIKTPRTAWWNMESSTPPQFQRSRWSHGTFIGKRIPIITEQCG